MKSIDREKAILLGMVVGDALGSTYEFDDIRLPLQIEQRSTRLEMAGGGSFHLKPGNWTDDASMGLCLAKGLSALDSDRHVPSRYIMDLFYDWWNYSYLSGRARSIGLGGIISHSVNGWEAHRDKPSEEKPHPAQEVNSTLDEKTRKKCNGNGSIMRCGAAAVFARTPEEAMYFGYEQSIITTPGMASANCARLLAFLCYKARVSDESDPIRLKASIFSPETFSEFISITNTQQLATVESNYSATDIVPLSSQVLQLCQPSGESYLNWKVPHEQYQLREGTDAAPVSANYYGAYVMEGMSLALHIIYNTNSFEEAVTLAALMGGDADSNAAVVGQLAGAIYGATAIPQSWLKSVNKHRIFPDSRRLPSVTVSQFVANLVTPILAEKAQLHDLLSDPDEETFGSMNVTNASDVRHDERLTVDASDSTRQISSSSFASSIASIGTFLYANFWAAPQKTKEQTNTSAAKDTASNGRSRSNS